TLVRFLTDHRAKAMMFGPIASGDMVALLIQQVSRRVRLGHGSPVKASISGVSGDPPHTDSLPWSSPENSIDWMMVCDPVYLIAPRSRLVHWGDDRVGLRDHRLRRRQFHPGGERPPASDRRVPDPEAV